MAKKSDSKLTPFKVMTSLLNNIKPTKEEKNSINSFFLVRWLSNERYTVQMANTINLYYNIPVYCQYQFCDDYIQLTNLKRRVKYISFTKEKNNANYQKLIENIQRKYKINEIQAEEYFKLMDNDQRNEIYNMYDEGMK